MTYLRPRRDFGFAESEAVKPTTKDNVVVGYLAESDKTTLEASIVGCL